MSLTLMVTLLAILGLLVVYAYGYAKKRHELERHSISAEELHSLMGSLNKISLFDVRQTLDVLAYPEQIPGAQRIPPEEVLENPAVIPKDKDVIVYCTCPSDKTSRMILRRALALGFSRIRFLRGGLAAWKRMGFPVEPYTGAFAFSAAKDCRSCERWHWSLTAVYIGDLVAESHEKARITEEARRSN